MDSVKEHDGMKSRKFIAAAVLQIAATGAWLVFAEKMNADQWISFSQSNMAIFALSSVAEKFKK